MKQIDISYKLDNLWFDETGTQENGHVNLIEIKLLNHNTGNKQDPTRWILWFAIKNLFWLERQTKKLWIR